VASSREHRLDNSLNPPPLNIPALLRQYGLRPEKRLGQNFLVDPSAIRQVVRSAEISPDDIVLEVGAGLGNLTRYLAIAANRVIAIEVDHRLIPPLQKVLSPYPNVEVVHDDILNLDPVDLVQEQPYMVTANIPYYITSAVIRHLLETRIRPYRVVLTVQHEVADRICVYTGNRNLLALSVQVFGNPKIVTRIPAGAFYPVPKVNSAVVRVDIYPNPRIAVQYLETFFYLIRAGFSQKRKTLRNALAASLTLSAAEIEQWLKSAGVDLHRRAETLSLDEWANLVQTYRHE
jgi:16S rRNA (adenine1518-N6/adenine1519-N6)-dimethyltransferase